MASNYPGLELIAAASTEPISLVTARNHLRLDTDGSPDIHPDDDWLQDIAIPAVRIQAEEFTGLALAQQTYRLTLDRFPCGTLELPIGPLVSVTSIKYDTADGEQTVDAADYVVDTSRKPGRISLAESASWPTPINEAGSVRVVFVAGLTTVPQSIVIGMLLLLGHLYKNREALTDREAFVMPLGVEAFLRPHRIRLGMA